MHSALSSTTSPVSALRERTAADLYNSDVYALSVKQADAPRRRDFATVGWDNVIEVIENVGRTDKLTWTSHCSQTIKHLSASNSAAPL